MDIKTLLSRLTHVRQCGANQWESSCPCGANHAHDDKNTSFRVSQADGRILVHCLKGCDFKAICAALECSPKDLSPDNPERPVMDFANWFAEQHALTLDAVYSYCYGPYDDGLAKLRFHDAEGIKTFKWLKRDSKNKSGYAFSRTGCTNRLYFAGDPAADTVYLVEGEKDCDTLHRLTRETACSSESGATTGGAGSKWRDEYTAQLKDKTVYILFDNDDAGRNFAQIEAQKLTGTAAHVYMLDLPQAWPECPEKGDISDCVESIGEEAARGILQMMKDNRVEYVQGLTVRDAVETRLVQQETDIPDFSPKGADYYNTADIRPPEPIVEDLIFPGLTLFAAPNKFAKSYSALELAFCVATGSPFMGKAIRRQGKVLYLDLEGTEARTKKRLMDLKRFPMPEGVEIQHLRDGEVRSVDNGITEQMRRWLVEHPDTVMIIIDMFKNVKGKKRREEDDYDAANRMYGVLEAFALTQDISVFMTTHTTKRSARDADDPFAEIMGSGGQFGTVDCGWILLGKRTDPTKRFCVLCRDGEGMLDYEVKFSDFKYSIVGTAEEVEEQNTLREYYKNPVVITIRKLVKEHGTWAGTSGDISDAVAEITQKMIDGNAGVMVKRYIEQLFKLDHIQVTIPPKNGGTKGRLYRFSKIETESPELEPDL